MGDRVAVYFSVLREQAEEAKSIIEEITGDALEIYDAFPTIPTVELCLDSVNYADVDEERLALQEAGIPHTWNHEAGGGYPEGYGYCIFLQDGTPLMNYFSPADENYPIDQLINEIQSLTQQELLDRVQDYKLMFSRYELHPDHIKGGKIYRLKKVVMG